MSLRNILACGAVLFWSHASLAAPSGKIGYIGPKGAQIWELTSERIPTLPRSARTDTLAMSPRGEAIFFVAPRQKAGPLARATPHQSFISRPPYRVSRPIAALNNSDVYKFLWNRGANLLYLSGYQFNGVFSPAMGRFQRLSFFPESFDRAGRKAGYSSQENLIIRDLQSGKERIIFSTKRPEPLFEALRRAKNPQNVADLLAGETPEKSAYSPWQLAGPAISPDGTRAYFSCNAGTGFGAAGNGMQGFFACDLGSGKISVLSKVGPLFGRPPQLSLSPDGKRLLAVSSVHSSAADNSFVALIIDLETQKSREVISRLPSAKNRANLFGGSAWSPDGKYVAISAYFYDADTAMKPSGEWKEPSDADWKTAIIEAATSDVWGVKTGMRAPQWIR